MLHIYEIETDGDPVWDVFESLDGPMAPATYRESFEFHNDLVTFLDNCTRDGVEFHLYPLTDWDDNA